MERQYHIGFADDHGAEYALLPGDPARVEKIAAYLDNPSFYCQNREYTTWLGFVATKPVLVMSTGMGGPSTAIGVEELYKTGVRNFLRVGTCGGMAADVIGGDIVIASGAIRAEGTSREYAPIEYPAVADIKILNSLTRAADELGLKKHVGVVHCKDSFYGQHDPGRMPVGKTLADNWEAWIKAGALASEMESAALFIVAASLRAKAGAVFSVVWNQERQKLGLDNPHVHNPDDAIRAAVRAAELLIRNI